jgi:L,D-transpeptidase-like protein
VCPIKFWRWSTADVSSRAIRFRLPNLESAIPPAVTAPLWALCLFLRNSATICPRGAVIKNRVPTGEVVTANAPGRDPIVSRVIWLRGMEEQNRGARDRCIYIHGTPEERQIGRPASFGCIRMRSRDVIALYSSVHIGMHVSITRKQISDFIRADEPSLLARSD